MHWKKALRTSRHDAMLMQVDALSKVFERHSLIHTFLWLLILLASIAAAFFLAINTIIQYNRNQVSSTIRYQRERNAVPFPTISVCPVNPFNTQFALDLLNEANESISDDMNEAYWHMFMQLEDYLNRTRGYRMTVEEKYRLTHFNESTLMNNLLSDIHLVRYFHPRYFNCLTYNPTGSLKALQVFDFF